MCVCVDRGGPFCNTLGIDHALIPGTGETTKNASAVQRWTCPRFFLANMTKTQGPTYPINVRSTGVGWFARPVHHGCHNGGGGGTYYGERGGGGGGGAGLRLLWC